MTSSIPATSGIYRITCTVTGRIYIGSAINLRDRRADHFKRLRRDEHENPKLQHAFNKYGEQSFTFEVIELVLVPFLLEREQYWLDTLCPFGDRGFNIARIAGSSLGREVSPETREKLRQANIGKPAHNLGVKSSPEAREKLRQANLGKKPLQAIEQNKGNTYRLGKKHSQATRDKISASRRGKPAHNLGKRGQKASPETRAKLSQMRLGHVVSPETRAKLSRANTGNKNALGREVTPEMRAKISRSRLGNKVLIVTAPDGTEYTVHVIREFCREHNLNSSSLAQVAKGRRSHHKNWTAHYVEMTD